MDEVKGQGFYHRRACGFANLKMAYTVNTLENFCTCVYVDKLYFWMSWQRFRLQIFLFTYMFFVVESIAWKTEQFLTVFRMNFISKFPNSVQYRRPATAAWSSFGTLALPAQVTYLAPGLASTGTDLQGPRPRQHSQKPSRLQALPAEL